MHLGRVEIFIWFYIQEVMFSKLGILNSGLCKFPNFQLSIFENRKNPQAANSCDLQHCCKML